MLYCYRMASGRYLADVSNLHCARSRQVLTDTPYTTSSRNPRLSGRKTKRARQRSWLPSFPVLWPSKEQCTLRASGQFLSCFQVGSFDQDFGICFWLDLFLICWEPHNLSLHFSIWDYINVWVSDSIHCKKERNLGSNLRDAIRERNFHATVPNTRWSETPRVS